MAEDLPEQSFQIRMKMLVDHVGGVEKLAKRANMSSRVISKYLAGDSDPSRERLIALAKAGGVNTAWLVAGEGPMKRGETVGVPAEPPLVQEHHFQDVEEDFVLIPRYAVAASAGGGAVIHSEQIVDYLSFRAEWIRNSLGLSEKDLALINVKGDSMEPTLSNEDLILVDLRTRGVEDNSVYVLQFNGVLLVKRLQRKFDGSVVVISDNTIYSPETISRDMVESLNVVGRVVWCGRRM